MEECKGIEKIEARKDEERYVKYFIINCYSFRDKNLIPLLMKWVNKEKKIIKIIKIKIIKKIDN